MKYFAGIEGGGTKYMCAVVDEERNIINQERIPTTSPEETLTRTINFFQNVQKTQNITLASIGIASFGPVDLNPSSPYFGYVTSTPKPGWLFTDVLGPIQKGLGGIPAAFDNDVNVAAIGEGRWGAAVGLDNFIYITVGTGIGGGAIVNGKPVHGLIHPEMGHLRLPHDWIQDPFAGSCPYHGDCWEGLATGPAMKKRWGVPAETLPTDHPAWDLEAHYIALALHNLVVTQSPKRIILGGGVMQQPQLLPMIRQKLVKSLCGYVKSPAIEENIEQFIVAPGLGTKSGVMGAVAIAMDACQ